MKCTQFEARVHELLDNRQRPEDDTRLQQHADECQDCYQLMLGQRMMLDGLDAFPPPEADHTLQADLKPEFDRLAASPASLEGRRFSLTRRLGTLVATAAALLLVVSLLVPNRDDPAVGEPNVGIELPDQGVVAEQLQPVEIKLPDPIRELLVLDDRNNQQAGSMLLASTSYRLVKFPLPHAAIGRQVQQLWHRGSQSGLPTEQIQQELWPLVQPVNTMLDTLRSSFRAPLQRRRGSLPDASSRSWQGQFHIAAIRKLRHLPV